MQQSRRLRSWVLLTAVLVAFGSRATTAEPERPEGTWRLPVVTVDADVRAAQLLERLIEALEAERYDEAALRLLALRRDHPDALVEAPASAAWEVPLLWPARRVVECLLERLPDAPRARVLDAWDGPARALDARARAGDDDALERLADRWGATEPGLAALRTLARRDLEAGHLVAATERLERWLRLATDATREARASAVLELVDARTGLRDARGLDEVAERWESLAQVGVSTAVGRTSPALRARKARRDLLEAARRTRPPPDEPVLPLDPAVLWTIDHERRGLGVDGVGYQRQPVRAGAAADGDHLLLHDGHSVRRIDAMTGRVAWQFPPPRPLAWDYAARVRYAAYDVPMRTVQVAGDLVLAVLGDPVGLGSFQHLGAEVRTAEESRESRTRLVALDRRTGKLAWATGRAGEADPVLGDLATGCHSPPLVVGDAVYAVFVRRRTVSEIHLARLDLHTGRPVWVRFLAAAESGRSPDIVQGDPRFRDPKVHSGPWGARPACANGEICVLPHAGFAAGVDASSGRVRWLRVLPRFAWVDQESVADGFSARNEPIAHAGTWILAPLDCPRLVGLAQGTGRWLWSRDPAADQPYDPWHDVLGVSDAPRGGPYLKLCDLGPALLPLARPKDDLVGYDVLDEYEPPGRPYDAGSRVVLQGVASPEPGEDGAMAAWPALVSVPWDADAAGRQAGVRRAVLRSSAFPLWGDVYRAGRVWVVVGTTRTGAVASFEEALAWVAAKRAGRELEPDPGADVLALEARLRLDADLAAQALLEAVRRKDPAGRAAALAAVRVLVDEQADGVERLAPVLLEHVPTEAAGLLADLVLLDRFYRRPDALVPLLDRWLEVGREGRVVSEPGLTIRADLYAGLVLRLLRDLPEAAGALEARDARHAALVDAALEAEPAALGEAIRRAVGTPAAAAGRRALARRLADGSRPTEAAALLADLRLDPGPDRPSSERALRRRLASLQGEQASLLARAGRAGRARRLLHDLERWAPEQPWPLEGGATARALAHDLARTHGWRPAGGAPTPARLDAPDDGTTLRTLVVPGLVGPGAARAGDRVVVFRGLGQEVWDLGRGRRLAAWPGPGRGWFGGTLQEVAPWLPDGGVVVTSLVAGEPADRAGLREGDWIVGWGGRAIFGAATFMRLAASAEPGVPLDVDVRRGGAKVLERFTPGDRPARDGGVVRRDVLYADARGRVLVPGRLDLAWIDPEAATRERLWAWTGTGVLSRVVVAGPSAVATVRRFREEDSLVAVDLETGAERWRTRVEGTVQGVEATGSAIVVTTSDPAAVVVHDLLDGSFRARVEVLERRVPAENYALAPAAPAALVHGRVWAVVPAREGGYGLRVVNTTTGDQMYEPLDDEGLAPLVAGDGVVAVATGTNLIELFASDPVTGVVRWRARTPPRRDPDAPDLHPSDIDANTRLFLHEDRLWITRTRRRQGLQIEGLEVDVTSLGPGGRDGEVPVRQVLRRIGTRRVQGVGATAYLLDASIASEGLVLSAGSLADEALRTVTWVDRYGRARSWPTPRGPSGGVRQMRRHPPARVGMHLVLPTDQGALLVPLAPGN